MAFKELAESTPVPETPDKLLRLLGRRKIPDVLPHQQEIMVAYAKRAAESADVALQLPTGSGKTLVGLMIAEWRRRKNGERAVYLCPTRQLVNQVVEQAEEKYGLSVTGFTGSIKGYEPSARTSYKNADTIAITTYNSLFNTNPFFDDPDLIIVDDAHSAESYIASMWTLRVSRVEGEHAALHAAICAILRPHIDPGNFARLTGHGSGPADWGWIDKLPTLTFAAIKDDLVSVFNAHVEGKADLFNPWLVMRDSLHGYQLYMSPAEILLRPLIPPTWTHEPFSAAKQRIFMSATLGAGGDLERLTGRLNILRLPAPKGWERQGVGRRFFMFPSMSLKQAEADNLRLELMKRAGRSLVLVPTDLKRGEIADAVEKQLSFKTFSAENIENSKKAFISNPNAAAIVANRYDGIDFPGDECRLLIIEGLPKATNLQERFLMARMGANVLLNGRIQTRVLQAIGRCTRSLEDYSAVFISGEELPDYLANIKKRPFLHPELQAELMFGIAQSKNAKAKDFIDNFDIFLRNDKNWEKADAQIIAATAKAIQKPFPAMDDLQAAVEFEINWQRRLWQGDFPAAAAAAERVLGCLKSPELQGYRALWHYLAGSAFWLASKSGTPVLEKKARAHFAAAKAAAIGLRWLVELSQYQPAVAPKGDEPDQNLLEQVERLESVLESFGTLHDGAF
jgi:DEAD/DEAH box helicase/Helicase C-terminal domain